ncbi:MAG: triose-phosphate isomerase [Planctomycetes bacterium]|nr:triose-phosphate isomerase [Planctomycetota bacterium]
MSIPNLRIPAPVFEIGPKNYLFGRDVVALAKAADDIASKHRVNVIFTAPYVNIAEIAACTEHIHVFAPHMDMLPVGRGLADILPESIREAGATGVMLNHIEKPLSLAALRATLQRARSLELSTIVCADSVAEAVAAAVLGPDMLVCEPSDRIGTGQAAGLEYTEEILEAIAAVNPDVGVLISGGISTGKDVYNVIAAGAYGTGSSSGVVCAPDPVAMLDEMVGAVRDAWNDRIEGRVVVPTH